MSNVANSKPINSCAACTKPVRSIQLLKCSKCVNCFHALCVNIPDIRGMAEAVRAKWLCPLCTSHVPKSDSTPVRAAAAGDLRVPTASGGGRNANTPACSPCGTPDPDPLEVLVVEMKLMREEVCDMKSQIKLLSDHLTTRLDDFGTKIREMEARETMRETELCSLQQTVAMLQEQLHSKAQAGLRNELEISGITEHRNENLTHVVLVAANKIGINLNENDLDCVTRVGPRHTATSASSKPPRTLVIRFVRRLKRDEFLKSAKSRRNLCCSDIEVEGKNNKIYFNERLTQSNRLLFRSARQRCSDAGFRYCWTKNGIIYVRKQEGSPAYSVKSPTDLERIRIPSSAQGPSPLLDGIQVTSPTLGSPSSSN